MQRIIGRYNFLIIISFMIALGVIYFTVFQVSSMVSLLIAFSFVYVFGFFSYQLLKGEIPKDFFGLIFFSILLVLVNTSVHEVGDFDYYKKAIMYIATLVWMICSIHVSMTRSALLVAFIIIVLTNVLYAFSYRQGFNVYDNEVLLTLNFSNPNQAGMFVLNSILYLIIFILSCSHFFKHKLVSYILLSICVPLLIQIVVILHLTGCRSAMLSLVLFCFLLFLDCYSRHKFRIKKWMVYFLVIFPFLAAFMYVHYVDVFSMDVSLGVAHEGKNVDTRMPVWGPVIKDSIHYIFCGDYRQIINSAFPQLHNTHLDVYASYGLVPFLLFLVILTKVMLVVLCNCTTLFQRMSFYAFICCIFMGTFEAAFVAGSAGLFFMICGFLIIANSKIDEDFTS